MTMRRIAVIAGAVLVLWLVTLRVLDGVLEAREERRVTERLAQSLQATATVGALELALVRGHLDLERLAIRRDDAVGQLAIDVAGVHCELSPLGLALVDSECDELDVTGTRLDVSTAALFQIKNPKHKPIRARRVVIDDAVLAFSPSAFVPDLGRIAIRIEHAEAGPTVFRTPLSWLFGLQQLRARLELPAGIVLRLSYAAGMLSAAGTLFGSTPVEVPVKPPATALASDAHGEVVALVQLGKDIAEQLVAKRAEDWLRHTLSVH